MAEWALDIENVKQNLERKVRITIGHDFKSVQ